MSDIDDILQMDDAVESLDTAAVKDAYARMAFMRAIKKAHSPRWLRTDEADDVAYMLGRFNNDGLKRISITALGREHPISQSLGWEAGRGNVETLFDRLTKDSYTEAELVDHARDHLKSALRGCGMPAMTVARERVKRHVDE